MSGILFAAVVVAFLVVVAWTFRNERSGGETAGEGLFGMTADTMEAAPPPPSGAARWKRTVVPKPSKPPQTGQARQNGQTEFSRRMVASRRPAGRPMPGWRRTLRYGAPPREP